MDIRIWAVLVTTGMLLGVAIMVQKQKQEFFDSCLKDRKQYECNVL